MSVARTSTFVATGGVWPWASSSHILSRIWRSSCVRYIVSVQARSSPLSSKCLKARVMRATSSLFRFLALQLLQARTRLPFIVGPPSEYGRTWSMPCAHVLQYTQVASSLFQMYVSNSGDGPLLKPYAGLGSWITLICEDASVSRLCYDKHQCRIFAKGGRDGRSVYTLGIFASLEPELSSC